MADFSVKSPFTHDNDELTRILYVKCNERLQVDYRNASQEQVPRIPYKLHVFVVRTIRGRPLRLNIATKLEI